MPMTKPGRWWPICQTCWEQVAPDRYFPDPERVSYGECALCGDQWAGVANIREWEIDDWYEAESVTGTPAPITLPVVP